MKKFVAIALLSFAASTVLSAQNNPKASQDAVVVFDNARFTVLTDRLVRMEWAEDGVFEDRASLAIVNRELPVPSFTTAVKGGVLTIKTGKLTLSYKGGRFGPENLSVKFGLGTWKPGMEPSGNLKGTTRTLDGCLGFGQISFKAKELEDGILSRDSCGRIRTSPVLSRRVGCGAPGRRQAGLVSFCLWP